MEIFFFHAMPMLKRKFKVEDYFHLIEKAPKPKEALLCWNRTVYYAKLKSGMDKLLKTFYAELCFLYFYEVRNRHGYFVFLESVSN